MVYRPMVKFTVPMPDEQLAWLRRVARHNGLRGARAAARELLAALQEEYPSGNATIVRRAQLARRD